jgi:sugar phosphate isomerase/epimerase
MYAAFGFHVSFEERVRLIAEAGFDCTSLWWEEKHERGRAFRDLAPPIARGAGLDIESVHVPYSWCNELWSDEAEVREGGLARHCGWLDDCSRHEVPIMVMHVTLGKTPPGVSEAGLEAYERLVEHGRNCGVVVAVENTRSDEHLNALFAQIDSPYLGLCYDVSHDVLHADEPGRLLREHGDRLVSTHFADTDGILDRHWLPGAGKIDYKEVLEDFLEGYEGVLMLEVSSGRKVWPIPEFVHQAYGALCEHVVGAVRGE